MIKPDELESEAGRPIWDTIVAAAEGDTITLRRLLDRDPRLGLSEYWYTPVIHFAVREHPDMLRTLLAHGMSPDLMNWQRQTLLHLACNAPDGRGGNVERAAILLDAGAAISARDDEYRSTPLAWAARTNASSMVELLLARGAPADLPDDEPWATPLAWAERRGHRRIAASLRAHGAKC